MKKLRIVSLLLTILMLVSLVPAFTVVTSAANAWKDTTFSKPTTLPDAAQLWSCFAEPTGDYSGNFMDPNYRGSQYTTSTLVDFAAEAAAVIADASSAATKITTDGTAAGYTVANNMNATKGVYIKATAGSGNKDVVSTALNVTLSGNVAGILLNVQDSTGSNGVGFGMKITYNGVVYDTINHGARWSFTWVGDAGWYLQNEYCFRVGKDYKFGYMFIPLESFISADGGVTLATAYRENPGQKVTNFTIIQRLDWRTHGQAYLTGVETVISKNDPSPSPSTLAMPTTLPAVGEATLWDGVRVEGGITAGTKNDATLPADLSGATITDVVKIVDEEITLHDNNKNTTDEGFTVRYSNDLTVVPSGKSNLLAGLMIKIKSTLPSNNGGGMEVSLYYNGVRYDTDFNRGAGTHSNNPFTYISNLSDLFTNGGEIGSWYYESAVNKIRLHPGLKDSWIFLSLDAFAANDGSGTTLLSAILADDDQTISKIEISDSEWNTGTTVISEADLVWALYNPTPTNLPTLSEKRWNGSVWSTAPGDASYGDSGYLPMNRGIFPEFSGAAIDKWINVVDFTTAAGVSNTTLHFSAKKINNNGLILTSDAAIRTQAGSTLTKTVTVTTSAKLTTDVAGVMFTVPLCSGGYGPGNQFKIKYNGVEYSSSGAPLYTYVGGADGYYASNETNQRLAKNAHYYFIALRDFKNGSNSLADVVAANPNQTIQEFQFLETLNWTDQGAAYVKSVDLVTASFKAVPDTLPTMEARRWNGGVANTPAGDTSYNDNGVVPTNIGIAPEFAGKTISAWTPIVDFTTAAGVSNTTLKYAAKVIDATKGLKLTSDAAIRAEAGRNEVVTVEVTTAATLNVNVAGIMFAASDIQHAKHGPGQFFKIVYNGVEYSSNGNVGYAYIAGEDDYYATHEGKQRFAEGIDYYFIALRDFKNGSTTLADAVAANPDLVIDKFQIIEALQWDDHGVCYIKSINLVSAEVYGKFLTAAPVLNENIDLIVTASIPAGATDAKIFFKFGGDDEFEADVSENAGIYTATFHGMFPQDYQTNLAMTLKYTEGGVEKTVLKNYSLAQYIDNMQAKVGLPTETVALINALEDYCEQAKNLKDTGAEIAINYNDECPVSDYNPASDVAGFTSASFRLENTISMIVKGTAGKTLTAIVNGRSLDVEEESDGVYVISNIWARDFNDRIEITDGGDMHLSYSVNNYIARMDAKTSGNMHNLLIAVYNYGVAACAYAH